jgi:rRNA-processing protein FCF1
VLTEVNSLLNSLSGRERERGLIVLAEGIKTSVEEYCPSRNLSLLNGFERYGLADLSIKEAAADQKYLVLTDDLKLYAHLTEQEVDAINFNHIRFL